MTENNKFGLVQIEAAVEYEKAAKGPFEKISILRTCKIRKLFLKEKKR